MLKLSWINKVASSIILLKFVGRDSEFLFLFFEDEALPFLIAGGKILMVGSESGLKSMSVNLVSGSEASL